MFTINQAAWDRITRVVVGAFILALGFGNILFGPLSLAAKITGFIPLITGLAGWSPLYFVFHFNTQKA